VDVATTSGTNISNKAAIQVTAISDLPMDLDQVVTRDGMQLQTVGHHWPGSGPLDKQQRKNMERVGVCLSCHQDIPNGTPSIAMIKKIREMASTAPSTHEEHQDLVQDIIRTATGVQVYGPIAVAIVLGLLVWVFFNRRKK
jgi:hypothetical protein